VLPVLDQPHAERQSLYAKLKAEGLMPLSPALDRSGFHDIYNHMVIYQATELDLVFGAERNPKSHLEIPQFSGSDSLGIGG
jgi:hypothetical protein